MGKVLSAQGSGYLPFCITPASTIPQQTTGTYYPFALTLDQLVSLFWRVKKWTYEDNLGPVGVSVQFDTEPENEETIVCNDNLYFYFRDFAREIGISRADIELFRNTTLKVGDLYYPYVSFYGTYLGGGDYATAWGDQEYSATGTFTISWLGYNISTPLYGELYETRPFIAKYTATEYWSYGGTYDTTTGAPL